MDILQRIEDLRKARNWTEYQLAERAGMTQSTISSWYRKNIIPSIPSLEKICDAFNITLSQFFLVEDHAINITEQQQRLLEASIKLNSTQLENLITFLNSYSEN